jgi:hypothetical protein
VLTTGADNGNGNGNGFLAPDGRGQQAPASQSTGTTDLPKLTPHLRAY